MLCKMHSGRDFSRVARELPRRSESLRWLAAIQVKTLLVKSQRGTDLSQVGDNSPGEVFLYLPLRQIRVCPFETMRRLQQRLLVLQEATNRGLTMQQCCFFWSFGLLVMQSRSTGVHYMHTHSLAHSHARTPSADYVGD